jgi:Fe-S oxidoreductase
LISKGLLNEAKRALNRFYEKLCDISKQDLIVGIDPSEALVWRDEAKFLVEKTLQVNLFEEAIIKLNKSNLLPELKPIDKKIYIHLHCHQKSLVGKQITIDALSLIPKLKVKILNTGCCGMAGDFAYKHPKVSHKILNQSLLGNVFKNIKSDSYFIMTGLACKNINSAKRISSKISMIGLFSKI